MLGLHVASGEFKISLSSGDLSYALYLDSLHLAEVVFHSCGGERGQRWHLSLDLCYTSLHTVLASETITLVVSHRCFYSPFPSSLSQSCQDVEEKQPSIRGFGFSFIVPSREVNLHPSGVVSAPHLYPKCSFFVLFCCLYYC